MSARHQNWNILPGINGSYNTDSVILAVLLDIRDTLESSLEEL